MLCVERLRGGFLPTISEYEPRCPPTIVVDLCSSSSRHPEVFGEDVPDCAHVGQPTVNRDMRGNSWGVADKRVHIPSDSVGSTKVRCLKEDAERIINELQQRRISNASQSDIRNKTISPSWDTTLSSDYKPNEAKDSQRNIRHTQVNPNSSALPSISDLPSQGINNSDIRNKTIRATSHGDSNTVRNTRPSLSIPSGMSSSSMSTIEPWKAVVTVRIGDQVRIWAKDSKNLVVEASANELFNLDSKDDNDTEGNQTKKATEQLIIIPDQINLDSLVATLSLEGQLIIKEIRQQKPSRGNIVVIPIEKM